MLGIKPWLDFSGQVALLRARGLSIPDETRAAKYLERIGYYRLSGYWHVFRQWDNSKQILLDTFIPGSDFESVLSLYLFDKKLRLLALDALERIEMAIRVDIVQVLGKRNPLAYKYEAYLDGRFTRTKGVHASKHQEWLKRFEQAQQREIRKGRKMQRSNKDKSEPTNFVTHNLEKYGVLPIWVASSLWDFGAMSYLYEGMQYTDRNTIAQKYGALVNVPGQKNPDNLFVNWLRSLNEIRNIAAHHDRLWNATLKDTSPPIDKDGYWKRLEHTRPFFYFCIMQTMLKVLCPRSQWATRFNDLLLAFPNCKGTRCDLSRFGWIDDYQNWDLWRK
ncbi:MAG: Abi family protein [Neisseria sp.]|nr:Abi family protein [Neisseria sp.]